MKPLRLTLEGFTCFKERQEIDFAGLDLFALTGPTGAGKSSLLDAMIFALYGKVPRVGKTVSELVSLGRDRMTVLFELEVTGHRLRVVRSVRRGKSAEAMLEEVVAGEPKPLAIASGVKEVDQEIGRRLGLGYEAFTQAVVLPQGEFARFLRSQPGDRRKILRDLLRLVVYERMREAATDRKKGLDAQVGALTHVLGDEYANANEQTLAAARAEGTRLAAVAHRMTTELASERIAVESTRALRDRTVALEAAERELARFEQEAGSLEAAREKLARARRAAPVIPRIEAAEGAMRAAAELAARAAQLDGELARATLRRDEAAAIRDNAELAAREVPALRERLRALDEVVGRVAALEAARERARRAQVELDAAQRALEVEQARRVERSAALARRRQDVAAAKTELAEVAFDAARFERMEALRDAASQTASAREQSSAAARASDRASAAVDEARKAEEGARERWEQTRAQHGKLLGRVEVYEDEVREAEREEAAGVLRCTLVAGEACPVCAQPVATLPPAIEVGRVQELVRKRDAARRDEEKMRVRVDKTAKEHAAAEAAWQGAQDLETRARAERLERAASLEGLELALREAAGADVEAGDEVIEQRVLAALRRLVEQRRRHEAARAALESASRALDEQVRADGDTEVELASLRVRIEQARARRAEADADANEVGARIVEVAGDGDPSVLRASCAGTLERLENEVVGARRAESEAVATLASLGSRREELGAASSAARAEEARLVRGALDAAREAGFADPPDARAHALAAGEMDALAATIDALRARRAEVVARVDALRSELGERRVDEATLRRREETLARLEHDEREAVRAQATAERDTQSLGERVERARKLAGDLAVASAERALYVRLASDLRSERFQAFLMEEAFRELASGASVRLLRLTSRYGLELREDEFFVVDHDNAQERRSADTLSGGETFLASLALALELSEQVQRAAGAVALDSVFIDEGFGTLDVETLDTVATALESLPTNGRMVGIITHLGDLSARLPARVVVERTPAGSRARLDA